MAGSDQDPAEQIARLCVTSGLLAFPLHGGQIRPLRGRRHHGLESHHAVELVTTRQFGMATAGRIRSAVVRAASSFRSASRTIL